MKKNDATIYLIESLGENNVYKIGYTKNNPEKRLLQLQSNNSNELRIVSTFKTEYGQLLERTLHRIFSGGSIRHEWFRLSTEDVSRFQNICERFEKNYILLEKTNEIFSRSIKM